MLAFDYDSKSEDLYSNIIKLSTTNIINDIIHVLNRYELRYNIKYSKIYLGGSLAGIANTEVFYNKTIKRNVQIVNPWNRVAIPQIVKDNLSKDASVFMNSLGLEMKHII